MFVVFVVLVVGSFGHVCIPRQLIKIANLNIGIEKEKKRGRIRN